MFRDHTIIHFSFGMYDSTQTYGISWGFDILYIQTRASALSLVLFTSTLYCSWYLSSMLAHIHHLSTHFAAPITFAFHLSCCKNRHKNPCCRGQSCAINIFCSGPGNGSFGSMRRSFCLVQ